MSHDMTDRLNVLIARFEAMAEAREEQVQKERNRGMSFANFIGLNSSAAAYRRCAEELKRVANGETPPPPNHLWDAPATVQQGG